MGYRVTETKDGIVVEHVRDFDAVQIFECGQTFRWLGQGDGSYTGVVMGRVVNARYGEGRLELRNTTAEDFKKIWFDYFDLGRDYSGIKRRLEKDPILRGALRFGSGMRILRQDLWEALISFIISANNNVPRIMKIVAALCSVYGDKIHYNGKDYFTFPGADRLAGAEVEELEVCRGGFRCRYIVNTSRLVKAGAVKLEEIKAMDTEAARSELTKLAGVGNKVADCTLLYSGTRQDVFPTDVWVKRVMEELYFKREATLAEIQDFARDRFGEIAGFAQQYLFYYARQNKIGVK